MIWLATIAKWLLGRLSALWRVILAHPWQFAVVALLALSWVLWARGDRYRDRLLAVQSAQKTATAAQIAVNHEPARKSEEIARKSDAEAPAYYEEGRRAGLAYAAAHRVRNACPVSGPDLPGADRPAEEHDGGGDTPGMVALSKGDFDILTDNSTRLAKVQADALALIEAGVAVEGK